MFTYAHTHALHIYIYIYIYIENETDKRDVISSKLKINRYTDICVTSTHDFECVNNFVLDSQKRRVHPNRD